MQKNKRIIPYLIVFGSFTAGFILIVVLMDLFLFPWLIHSRDTAGIPNVIGKNVGEARKILEASGFNIDKITEQNSDSIPTGLVLNQVPKAGQQVKTERNIYLVISKGAVTGSMPYLLGLPSRTARINLSNKGFININFEYIYSDQYGADTIAAQNFPSGKELPLSSPINISVSKGPEEQVLVPQLERKSIDDVNKILLESGLTLGNIEKIRNETFQPNTVIKQSPESGTLVKKGTPVNIIISGK